MSWDDIQQIVRIVLYAATGWLVNAGQLDPANAETLAGGALAIVSVAWWWFWNRRNRPAA